jgi:hypothetical protein
MKGFSFLISLGCSAFCREPANHRNRQRECQRVLDKIFDGQVLNEDDEHELECLAGQDPLIIQQILAAELRLRRDGNVVAANNLLMILDRVTPGETVIQEDAPRLELMDRDIREGGSVPSHSYSPSQLRHRRDHLIGTTYSREASNQTIAQRQEAESRSVTQDPQRAASSGRGSLPAPGPYSIGPAISHSPGSSQGTPRSRTGLQVSASAMRHSGSGQASVYPPALEIPSLRLGGSSARSSASSQRTALSAQESQPHAPGGQYDASGLSSAFPYSLGFPTGGSNIQGSGPGRGGSNLPGVQSTSTSGRGARLNLPGLHSSGSNVPSSASGRGTGLLVPGRQRGGPNSRASGSSQASVTPRGAGAAQTRGSGTSPSGNQAPQQAEPRLRTQGRTGQSPESKPSNPFTHSPVRGNQRT